jgi:hypothetical protein
VTALVFHWTSTGSLLHWAQNPAVFSLVFRWLFSFTGYSIKMLMNCVKRYATQKVNTANINYSNESKMELKN